MDEDLHFARAVADGIAQWKLETTLDQRIEQLSAPAALTQHLSELVRERLVASGLVPADVCQRTLARPFVLLEAAFDPSHDVDTPVAFSPVPETEATVDAQAAALAVHGVLNLETVSYGTENDGSLFVNLVVMPGKGRYADKSKSSLRGHTDAVSFPLAGADFPDDPRVAPSPDVVTLVGLRNPKNVPTTVMALEDVLGQMSPDDVLELKKKQFSMNSQLTFVEGMLDLFGEVLVAHGEAVLTDVGNGTHVRYSHKQVMPTDPNDARAREASDRFEAACNAVAQEVVIKPGDVLVVSNRMGLHGRGEPGEEHGGKSRWLLRTYGLDTSALDEQKRHLGDRPPHVLYP